VQLQLSQQREVTRPVVKAKVDSAVVVVARGVQGRFGPTAQTSRGIPQRFTLPGMGRGSYENPCEVASNFLIVLCYSGK